MREGGTRPYYQQDATSTDSPDDSSDLLLSSPLNKIEPQKPIVTHVLVESMTNTIRLEKLPIFSSIPGDSLFSEHEPLPEGMSKKPSLSGTSAPL